MLCSQCFGRLCLDSSFLSIDQYHNMRFHCGLIELSAFAWKLFCKWYISTFKPSQRTVLGERHRFVMELISAETYSEVRRPLNNIPVDTSLLGLFLARGWMRRLSGRYSPLPGVRSTSWRVDNVLQRINRRFYSTCLCNLHGERN